MKTLADAWAWYESTKRNLARMQRLGRKHWDDPSLEAASIWQDDQFRLLEASDTTVSLRPIDDLAVVVLFSVFEADVRQFLVARMKPEQESLNDPILKDAAADAVRGVEEGSFYRRVLDPLKAQGRVSGDLVTQVDQVREYRNWVAHGRREREGERNNVTPRVAYERLREFLTALGIAVEAEQPESDSSAGEYGAEPPPA